MKILSDFNLKELEIELANYTKFRAKQIFDAIHQAKDFSETTLPKRMTEQLAKDYILKPVSVYEKFVSKDGTIKYLLKLNDDNLIECVFLHQDYGNTICMSTQVGCRMGCKFCASTIDGLKRNLSAGEMLSMIAAINADNGKCNERNFTNIVLMGNGEPLDNFESVIRWIKLITNEASFNISERNISLSTCGLVDKIYELSKQNLSITLCVSLHATTDEIRRTIMPIANRYTIKEIIEALKVYVKENSRRVVFEYCLIKDVNDSFKDCERLAILTKNLLCHVNVICLNPNGGSLKATTKSEAYAFVNKLNELGVSATLRRSQGDDIDGACGQLRAKFVGDSDTTYSDEKPE